MHEHLFAFHRNSFLHREKGTVSLGVAASCVCVDKTMSAAVLAVLERRIGAWRRV